MTAFSTVASKLRHSALAFLAREASGQNRGAFGPARITEKKPERVVMLLCQREARLAELAPIIDRARKNKRKVSCYERAARDATHAAMRAELGHG
jgi:hypothetical protein